jgi:hypothetical protein
MFPSQLRSLTYLTTRTLDTKTPVLGRPATRLRTGCKENRGDWPGGPTSLPRVLASNALGGPILDNTRQGTKVNAVRMESHKHSLGFALSRNFVLDKCLAMLARVTMASPAVERRMPPKTNLELFGPVAIAYLMDGPKPQPALNEKFPISVLQLKAMSRSSVGTLPRLR